jgi:N6-L-threonylcarbamoyladenine synthase
MLILGIESSCDDTGVAVVENGKRVLASCVSNQTSIHAAFGGVVPEIAAREHLTNIYPLFEEALHKSGITAQQIDAIAVTQGPGLVGALLVGISFAKGLASSLTIPLIPVDHVHAHIHGALLGLPAEIAPSSLFPGLALVVSGGHTHLYLMTSATSFTLLASSVDDACGECFDKVAKVMGLESPARLAKTLNDSKTKFVARTTLPAVPRGAQLADAGDVPPGSVSD